VGTLKPQVARKKNLGGNPLTHELMGTGPW